MDKEEAISFAEDLESGLEDSDVATTAIYHSDSIGFPLRITDPDQENLEGEPSSFGEAYDFAVDLLGDDRPDVYEEGGYVWIETSTGE